MSRIGNLPVELTEGTSVEIIDGLVKISGPKGTLSRKLPRQITVLNKDKQLIVQAKSNTKLAKSLHGTYRALLYNMVTGVTQGWTKELELVGAGYRAEVSSGELVLNVGYSNPARIKAPEGISFKVEKTRITVEGIDRAVVGQTAAIIRDVRPPEPYKGKGIMYVGEKIRRKAGKAAKTQGA